MDTQDDSVLVPATGTLVPNAAHLTAGELRARLEEWGNADPESGHGLADDLMREALTAIRDGHPEPQKLAAVVLHAEAADFARWYA